MRISHRFQRIYLDSEFVDESPAKKLYRYRKTEEDIRENNGKNLFKQQFANVAKQLRPWLLNEILLKTI